MRIQLKHGEKCDHCGLRYVRDVAADAIAVADGKIALIKRSKEPSKGMWALPGGMLDWDESAEEAVVREFEEETSLKGKLGRFVGVYSDPNRDSFQRVAVVYEVVVVGGKLNASDDAADAKWFPLDDLPELAVDHGKMVEDYKRIVESE